MEQLLMHFRTKAVLLYIILGLMSGTIASINSGSDEDDSLKQALFLVNLLKTEYIRVLRENTELKRVPLSDSAEQNNATCPTTLEDSNTRVVSTSQITKNDAQMKATSSKAEVLHMEKREMSRSQSIYQVQPITIPAAYAGRRMMRTYDGYGKLRRMNYEDPFGEHPGETEITTISTPQIDEGDIPGDGAVPNDAPAPNDGAASIDQELTPSVVSSSMITSTTKASTQFSRHSKKVLPNDITQRFEKKLTNKSIKSVSHGDAKKHELSTIRTTTEPDNVMSQVASELMNELNGDKEKLKYGLEKIHSWFTNTQTPQSMKTTMKMYLEGSSRFPVPLPENHAFCHTNPNNPLCRTFIG